MKAKEILVLTISIIAFQVGMQEYSKNQNYRNRVRETEETENLIKKTEEEAVKKHPGDSVYEAIQKEAESKAKSLASEPDVTKRSLSAASMFYGFYFLNTRARPGFCRIIGVDISSFVKEFERIHIDELSKAKAILTRSKMSEAKLYSLVESQQRHFVDDDMKKMAISNHISEKQACQLIEQRAEIIANEMHISKVSNDIYSVLNPLN